MTTRISAKVIEDSVSPAGIRLTTLELEYPRDKDVIDILPSEKLWCLGKTKHGHPRHPLYLKSDTAPERMV